jgi:hypothetical protein
MSTDIDVLLSLYKEELAYAKHHSAMRANVTSLICVIASATLALARSDDLLMADLPLTIFIALLGIFGVIFNLKQYERGRLHRKRAKYIRILVKKKKYSGHFVGAGLLQVYNLPLFKNLGDLYYSRPPLAFKL